ncbi:MAG: nucleotidyltransferase domain-containing protein [Nitrosomonadales bacterium]|nr:nucleotidyltransferase domain-containing protein [Nitrosomonadales bacterium]
MGKERNHRRDLMREHLAHHAARLMAEGGITDYAFAKRKAARQMGATDTHHLPSNQQVEEALRSFRSLYQGDSHPGILRQLRAQALHAMRLLEPFQPYLTGSVLGGTAGEQSDINLVIYSDDEKSVMMFLLKRNLPFESGEWRAHLAGRQQTLPSFTLQTGNGVPVHITVLPGNARHSGDRKAETRADAAAVEALLG